MQIEPAATTAAGPIKMEPAATTAAVPMKMEPAAKYAAGAVSCDASAGPPPLGVAVRSSARAGTRAGSARGASGRCGLEELEVGPGVRRRAAEGPRRRRGRTLAVVANLA